MLLYLGSDSLLPEVPWDESRPSFHVVPATQFTAFAVRRHLGLEHVYVAGSAEKCACCFDAELWRDDDDISLRRDTIVALRTYLNGVSARCRSRLYACWAGTEREPIAARRSLWPAEASEADFLFAPRTLVEVIRQPTPRPE
jgi:hypothetical protein